MPWKKYESRKIVEAAQIVNITQSSHAPPVLWVSETETFEPNETVMRYRAEVGGFAIIYSDGYKSVSPKKAFVEGYVCVE